MYIDKLEHPKVAAWILHIPVFRFYVSPINTEMKVDVVKHYSANDTCFQSFVYIIRDNRSVTTDAFRFTLAQYASL